MGYIKQKQGTMKQMIGTIIMFIVFIGLLYVLGSSFGVPQPPKSEYDVKVEFCNIIGCETYYCDEVKKISATKYELYRDENEEPYLVMDVNKDVNVKTFRLD